MVVGEAAFKLIDDETKEVLDEWKCDIKRVGNAYILEGFDVVVKSGQHIESIYTVKA